MNRRHTEHSDRQDLRIMTPDPIFWAAVLFNLSRHTDHPGLLRPGVVGVVWLLVWG